MDYLEAISSISDQKVEFNSFSHLTVNQPDNTPFLNAISEVDATVKEAEANVISYALGDNSVQLHEVMISLEKAKMMLQTSVEVRNKLVESYKEITSMQI